MSDTKPTFKQAVFIGHRGEVEGQSYHMPGIYNSYLYFDKDGKPIDFAERPDLIGKDPTKLAGLSNEVINFRPGDLVILPTWDEELLEEAYRTGEFGKPECQKQVQAMHQKALQTSNEKGGSKAVYMAVIAEHYGKLLEQKLVLLPAGQKEPDAPQNESAKP